MTRFFNIILVALLAIALLGCEDGAVAPSSEGPESAGSETTAQDDQLPRPASVLNGNANLDSPLRSKNAHGPSSNGSSSSSEFSTPVFGLATAPNGDILVADAGAGIATP